MSTYSAVQALNPFGRFLAQYYGISSGGTTVDYYTAQGTGGGNLNQTNASFKGPLPATSSALNNQLVANLGSGKFYRSTLAASSWNFLHRNVESEVFVVGLSDTTDTYREFSTQGSGGTSAGATFWSASTGFHFLADPSGQNIGYYTAYDSPPSAGTAYWGNYSVDRSNAKQPFDLVMRSGNASTGMRFNSFNIAAENASNASFAFTVDSGNFAEIIIFNKVLTDSERNTVFQYIKNTYGLVVPEVKNSSASLTGVGTLAPKARPQLILRGNNSLSIIDGTAGNVAVNYSLQVSLLNPFSRIRAKENISSSGKATQLLDLSPVNPSHVMAQASSTLQAPTPIGDSNINGRELLIVNNSLHKYISSFPPSSWSFLHKDGPKEIIWIGVNRYSGAGSVFAFSTREGATGNVGFLASIQTTGRPTFAASNATASNSIGSEVGVVGYAVDEKFYADYASDVSLSPDMNLVRSALATLTGNNAVTGSNADPQFTMQLGNPITAGETGFVEWIIFDRTLSQPERDIVRRYVKQYYDINSGLTPAETHPNGVGSFSIVGSSIANSSVALSSFEILDLTGRQPPSLLASTPTGMQSGRWKFTFTSPVSSATGFAGGDFIRQTLFTFGSQSNELAIFGAGGSCWLQIVAGPPGDNLPISWSASQPVTIIVDTTLAQVTISGALSGNGTFNVNSGFPWAFPSGALYIGQVDSFGNFPFNGAFSDVTYDPDKTGILAIVGSSVARSSATLTGTNTLIGTATAIARASVTLGSSSGLVAYVTSTFNGIAPITGVGTLAATGTSKANAVSALTGTGSLVAVGTAAKFASCSLSGSVGNLATAGQAATAGVAALTGVGSIAATGFAFSFKVNTAGLGELSSIGQMVINATSALSSTAFMLIFTTSRCRPTAEGTLNVAGGSLVNAENLCTGIGFLSSAGSSITNATCNTAPSVGTLSSIARSIWNATANLTSTGTLQVKPDVRLSAIGTSELAAIGVGAGYGEVNITARLSVTMPPYVTANMSGTSFLLFDLLPKWRPKAAGALAVAPHIKMNATGKGTLLVRQVAFGFQDNSYNLLALPAIAEFLGWEDQINIEEVQKLDIYLFIIESIRIEDQNQGAFFLKRFLQGPQEIWNKTQESIFNLKDLWDIHNVPAEYLTFMKAILGWTPEFNGITDNLDTNALRRLLIASVPIWKRRGTDEALLNLLTFINVKYAKVFDWFYYRWIIGDTGFDFNSVDIREGPLGNEPWMRDVVGEHTYSLRLVDDGITHRDLIRNLAKAMRPLGERIEINYLLFMEYFDAITNEQWKTHDFSSQSLNLSTFTFATTYASAPGWLRNGSYKINFQPYFNSSSVVTFRRNFLVSFSSKRVPLAHETTRLSTSGIRLEGSVGAGWNLIITNQLGDNVIFSIPVSFAANTAPSIEIDTSGEITVTGFLTGNGIYTVPAWSFGSDFGMTIGRYWSAAETQYSTFNGVVNSILHLGVLAPVNQSPLVVNEGHYGQMLSTDTNVLAVAQPSEGLGILAEYLASARIRGDEGWRWGFAFYVEDQDNFHVVFADDDNRWHLCECVDGGMTEIASAPNPGNRRIYQGVWYNIRVQVCSTTSDLINSIQVYIDGCLVISVTDDTLFGGSVAIVKLNKETAVSFSQVEIISLPAVSNDFAGLNS